MRTRTAAVAAVLGLTIAALLAPTATTPAHAIETIHCTNEDTADDNATPYFDSIFDPSHYLSQNVLNTYVPQGLTTWRNYYGAGHDLLVYTAYHEDEGGRRAVIQGIDQRDGSLTHYVPIGSGHAGGVAIYDRWAFVSGPNNTVRRYLLSNLAARFSGRETGALDGAEAGTVYASSFLAIEGNTLFAGRWSGDANDGTAHRDRMYRYSIDGNGNLSRIGDASDFIEVPKRTQGLLVLPNYFVYSTSEGRNNRSNLYVVRRGFKWLDSANPDDLRCFRAPTMTEGVTISQDRVYQLFESGADKYANALDKPDRIIKRLYWADREELPLIP